MVRLSYDLHIHSCLSPCGDDDMLPSNIVGMAALKELDVIAVTDHNSCLNCPAVMKLAEAYGVTAIPGMELTTAEEVHVVCLFPTLEKALEFSEYVYSKLLPFPNDETVFGKQQIVDEDDNVVGKVENLLINATDIYFYELYDLLKEYDGLMIPAHVDKSANSLLSNLGFIPPDSRFKTAEIKHIGFMEDILEKNPYLKDCVIISDSDAHYLENINEPINFIEAESKSIADVFKALRGKE
ncbi:MAG: PHP domain-containing protein [Ruminococcus sp.]|nr:PHP domain-containing protein [Ruminococcus sp.]